MVLSIETSDFHNNSAVEACAGVQLSKNTTATLYNCSFIGNKAPGGTALTGAWNVSIELDQCLFRGNVAPYYSVIYLRRNVRLYANNTVIDNNDGQNGHLIETVENQTSVHLERVIIHNNIGRGILNIQGNLIITKSHVIGNSGRFIIGAGNGTIIFESSLFEQNSASIQGGVFAFGGSDAYIKGCSFTNNSARIGGVGYIDNPSRVIIFNSTFSHNQAEQDGGALLSYGTTLQIFNSTMSDNTAGTRGGAIYVGVEKMSFLAVSVVFTQNKAKQFGGAVDIDEKKIDAVIENCTFLYNSADLGATELSIETTLLRIAHSSILTHNTKQLIGYNNGPMVSYLFTYNSTVRCGNLTFSTGDTKFIAAMQSQGLIYIPKDDTVKHQETQFASGITTNLCNPIRFVMYLVLSTIFDKATISNTN